MRIPLLTLLTLLLPAISALTFTPRKGKDKDDDKPFINKCFDRTHGQCVGRSADPKRAYLAVKRACAQVPTCAPGQFKAHSGVVGKVPGITATLKLGEKCGGIDEDDWDEDSCAGLFTEFIDQRCKGSDRKIGRPDMDVQLGYIRSVCDDTFVSLNY